MHLRQKLLSNGCTRVLSFDSSCSDRGRSLCPIPEFIFTSEDNIIPGIAVSTPCPRIQRRESPGSGITPPARGFIAIVPIFRFFAILSRVRSLFPSSIILKGNCTVSSSSDYLRDFSRRSALWPVMPICLIFPSLFSRTKPSSAPLGARTSFSS